MYGPEDGAGKGGEDNSPPPHFVRPPLPAVGGTGFRIEGEEGDKPR